MCLKLTPAYRAQTVVAEPLAKRIDQLGRFGRRDVARRVAHHAAVLHGHQVAPHGHLARLELDTHGSSLDGPPAGVVDRGIEAHDAHAGHRAGGLHALRHVVGDARGALLGQSIEIGRVRGFQGRAPLQSGRRPPRRPIDYEHYVLHPGSLRCSTPVRPIICGIVCSGPRPWTPRDGGRTLAGRQSRLGCPRTRPAWKRCSAPPRSPTWPWWSRPRRGRRHVGAARPYVVPMNFAYEPPTGGDPGRPTAARAGRPPAPAHRAGPQGRGTRRRTPASACR